MDILGMLNQQLSDPKALEELGKKAGARPDQAQNVAQNALPAILGALKQNAASPDGAKSLNKALEDHKNDNVGDTANFLKNVDTNDGAKMLQHIFGNKNENVQKDLAQKSGVDTSQVFTLLAQLAPLVLGVLGNKKKEQGGSDVMGLIGNVLGGFFNK